MLDEERRAHVARAGKRFREAEGEKAAAAEELKMAFQEADGDSSPEEAAGLSGLGEAESAVLLGYPTDEREGDADG